MQQHCDHYLMFPLEPLFPIGWRDEGAVLRVLPQQHFINPRRSRSRARSSSGVFYMCKMRARGLLVVF